jgi:hypothetical protein
MNKLLSQKKALNLMIALLIVVLLFHTLVLTGIIPYSIVWAGKISSVKEMRIFETVSIIINAFLIIILLLRSNYIQNRIPWRRLNVIIWVFIFLFGLNTIGNLFAKSKFELYLFTPLTFISAILCLRIVIEKEK